jgi:catalase
MVRLAVTGFIVAVVVAFFGYAGGWLRPDTLTPARMIDGFEQVNGRHPGFRRNHAKGVGVTGYFDSNGQGVSLSKAAVFLPGRTPVLGRFAAAVGTPDAADTPHTIRSMALLFKLSDGEQWRTGMNDIPVFPLKTPQAFYEQVLASAPDPATGKPDPAKMGAFLAENPATGKALQLIGKYPFSSGFENSTYNSLNAFRFINGDGKVSPVRWAMVPVQAFVPVDAANTAQTTPNYLFDALAASIHSHPLQWHLVITVGQPGDPTSDATLPWPADRQTVEVGTLTIDQIESEDDSLARDINFDPLVLPDGISPSDDPLLSARSATYAVSYRRREGERKTPSAVSPAELQK